MNPQSSHASTKYEGDQIVSIQFNVINVSQNQEPQIAHVDLVGLLLTFTNNHVKCQLMNIMLLGKAEEEIQFEKYYLF